MTLHDDIPRLVTWLAETDIGVLELRGPDLALRLRQGAGGVQVEPLPDDDAPAADTDVGVACVITAPSVGLFLARHPLRGDDLAPLGTAVVAGQVLGLLQTGALLRPVPAPCGGIVTAVLAAPGSAVGYGTPLFTLDEPC